MINFTDKLQKDITIFRTIGITFQQLDILLYLAIFVSLFATILKINTTLITCFFVFCSVLIIGMKLYKIHRYRSLEYKMSILAPILESKEFAEYQKTLLSEESENK